MYSYTSLERLSVGARQNGTSLSEFPGCPQQRTLSRTQTLPLKVTMSVPTLGSPSGVLALRLLKALRQFAQSHRNRFQTSVCAHQHSSKAAAESSSALQAMTRTCSRRLSFASLIASRRTWMIASNSH